MFICRYHFYAVEYFWIALPIYEYSSVVFLMSWETVCTNLRILVDMLKGYYENCHITNACMYLYLPLWRGPTPDTQWM